MLLIKNGYVKTMSNGDIPNGYVLIGDDGQVKEYREETTYSSIGEPHHRHISHLVGLYPGTLINDTTPEWLEGARVTLRGRGDASTCWAAAPCPWAECGRHWFRRPRGTPITICGSSTR